MRNFKLFLYEIFFKSWWKAYQETIENRYKKAMAEKEEQIKNLKELNRTLANKCTAYAATNTKNFEKREYRKNGFY